MRVLSFCWFFLFVLLVLFFYPIMSVTNLLVRSIERQKKISQKTDCETAIAPENSPRSLFFSVELRTKRRSTRETANEKD